MKDFAAIDFETANVCRSSICSVGVVIVKGGMITEKLYRLIHPTPNYFSVVNTSIHGLSRRDTDSADYFPEVWAEIAPKIEGLPLVAHNSSFDESCLKAVFNRYEMQYPDYEFHCTCRASRKYFGKKLASHNLHAVALHCGYDLRNHHHALADAEACAAIAMQIL